MDVFWDRGYHDASLPDLLAAMDLSRGSFYKAFGDKRGIFLRALDVYADDAVRKVSEILSGDASPKKAIRDAFTRYADLSSELKGRRGCLVILTAAEMLPGDQEITLRIATLFRRLQDLFAAAIIRGQALGEIDTTLDDRAVARFLFSQVQGMRVLGKVGASHAEMQQNIDMAMRSLD